MARAKRAASQLNQTKSFKNQVLEYAKEYEGQMLAASSGSLPIAFLQDTNAFREKLIQS